MNLLEDPIFQWLKLEDQVKSLNTLPEIYIIVVVKLTEKNSETCVYGLLCIMHIGLLINMPLSPRKNHSNHKIDPRNNLAIWCSSRYGGISKISGTFIHMQFQNIHIYDLFLLYCNKYFFFVETIGEFHYSKETTCASNGSRELYKKCLKTLRKIPFLIHNNA